MENAAVFEMPDGEPVNDADEREASNDDNPKYTWNKDTLDKVKRYAEVVDDVRAIREDANAQLAAAKSTLVADGFNKDALQAALSYANTPEEKRKNWDESYIFARKSLGVPIQEDLFTAAMQDEVTVGGD